MIVTRWFRWGVPVAAFTAAMVLEAVYRLESVVYRE
jgi:hypothetical protein